KVKAIPAERSTLLDLIQHAQAGTNGKLQFRLASRYAAGIGAAKNPKQALAYLEKSASQSNTDAMLVLAENYVEGTASGADEAKARTWYVKAAEAGDVESMELIADAYDY